MRNTSQPSTHSQSGQIAVVVLLIMVVLLVIGLSLATRTTEESFFSQQSSETARVWNAAETGAEAVLSNISSGVAPGSAGVSTQLNDSQVTASVEGQSTLQMQLSELSTATVNLETTKELFYFDIYWGTESNPCDRASLLVTAYYGTFEGTRAAHYTFSPNCTTDPNDPSRSGDGFIRPTISEPDSYLVGYAIEEGSYDGGRKNHARIYLPDAQQNLINSLFMGDPLFARIKPVYGGTDILVTGPNLPDQSYVVTSTAENTKASEVGREVRTVEVTRSFPAAPGFLDYAVYSGGSISKP